MQERLPADVTFLWAVAVKQAVYAIQEPVASTIPDLTVLAEGTGMATRKLDRKSVV